MIEELADSRTKQILDWLQENQSILAQEILTIELHMNKDRIVPKVILHPKPIGTK